MLLAMATSWRVEEVCLSLILGPPVLYKREENNYVD